MVLEAAAFLEGGPLPVISCPRPEHCFPEMPPPGPQLWPWMPWLGSGSAVPPPPHQLACGTPGPPHSICTLTEAGEMASPLGMQVCTLSPSGLPTAPGVDLHAPPAQGTHHRPPTQGRRAPFNETTRSRWHMGERRFWNWHVVFYLTVRALHLKIGATVELAKGPPHCVPHGPLMGPSTPGR